MIFVFQITEVDPSSAQRSMVGPAAPRPRRTKTLIQLNRSRPLVSASPEGAKHQTPSTENESLEVSSYSPVSLSEFPHISVMHVLEAASRCTVGKFIPGNMAHFFLHRMTDPVSALPSDMCEQDDNYPNIACHLIARYPRYTMDAYDITSAMLVLSVRFGMKELPGDVIDTLCVKPSRLSVTASDGGPAHQRLVVGNYTLRVEDMDTLKPKQWINDNVSTVCIIYVYILNMSLVH